MIIKRQWVKNEGRKTTFVTGYFFIGVLPLYIDYKLISY
jgi:hypothetical protein